MKQGFLLNCKIIYIYISYLSSRKLESLPSAERGRRAGNICSVKRTCLLLKDIKRLKDRYMFSPSGTFAPGTLSTISRSLSKEIYNFSINKSEKRGLSQKVSQKSIRASSPIQRNFNLVLQKRLGCS